jgi:3D (Asp-Asp-Asp) domain-containing protein
MTNIQNSTKHFLRLRTFLVFALTAVIASVAVPVPALATTFTISPGQYITFSFKWVCNGGLSGPYNEPVTGTPYIGGNLSPYNGLTATLSPNPGTSNVDMESLTITAPNNAVPGSYSILVDGVGNPNGPCPTYVYPQFPTTITLVVQGAQISLQRLDLTTVQATGTPSGGTFTYNATAASGKNITSIDYASGMTDITNPNITKLSDPPNPTWRGTPTPGGLANIQAGYSLQQGTISATDSFSVPTFGMSCYYTTLESDWGTPPNRCKSVRISGIRYKGSVTNPPNLTGTFCSAFIAEVKLQGSGVLNNGSDVQYGSSAVNVVGSINGADGTPVVAGQTVARDRSIISGTGVHVNVDQVGTGLLANDTGGAIKGYRLDFYKGAGKSVCSDYSNIISVSACDPGSGTCPSSTIK